MIRMLLYLGFLILLFFAWQNGQAVFGTWKQGEASRALDKATTRQEIDNKRREVQRGQEFQANLPLKMAELSDLAATIRKNSERIPDGNPKMPELVTALGVQAERAGVVFRTVRPSPERRLEIVSQIPVEIDVEGTYVQIMSFLDSLAALKRLVAVDRVNLDTPVTRGSNRIVSAKVTLLAPYLTRSLDQSLEGVGQVGGGGP